MEEEPRVARRPFAAPDYLLMAVMIPASFLPPFVLGRDGYLLFDYSLVVDAGWRILNGQLPLVDFVLPSGPGCFILQALFFMICGPNLYAPLVHAGVLNTLAALTVYWILRRESNRPLALCGGLATAAWFYLPYPFPWYDTTAFFFVLLAQAVYALRVSRGKGPVKRLSFLMGLLAGAAFLSKQNIGLFAFILYALLLVSSEGINKPGRILSFITGFMAAVGGYLLFNTALGGGAVTLEGLFVRPALMGRGSKLLSPRTWEAAFRSGPVWMLTAALAITLVHALLKSPRPGRMLRSGDLAGLTALCLLAAVTGTAPKHLFLPFMGLCMGSFGARFITGGPPGNPGSLEAGRRGAAGPPGLKTGILLLLLLSFTAWGGWAGASRVAKTYALRRCGFQTGYALKHARLRPFTMDERLGRALDEALLELEHRNARREGFYVFPNATVCYLALGYVSPVPYVWLHPGQSFFQEDLNDEIRLIEALESAVPKWIVMWDAYQFPFDSAELIRFMSRLQRFIDDRYALDLERPCFRILSLRP